MTIPNRKTYKLDQKFVDQLPYITSGSSKIYFDQSVKGFGVAVGKTVKSYILQREVNRKSVRVTIARSTEVSVARAREEARNLLYEMRHGVNPNEERREAIDTTNTQNGTTLQHLLDQHVKTLNAKGFEYAFNAYPKTLKRHVADWLYLPVHKISREMVITRHRKIGEHSHAAANTTFRIIRALLNQHRIDTPDFSNPVEILSLKKLWFTEKARDIRIKSHEMKPWIQALYTHVENVIHRDYMLFLLFNGLRRNEAARLEWEHVDFRGRTFLIEKTKNKKPLELPMSDITEMLLKRMWNARDTQNGHTSKWVFPSALSASGHITEPKKSLAAINTSLEMSIRFHDLRRTFVSVANSVKISPYTIKKLVNHSVGGDVTAAVYNVMDVDDLREPMQQIADQYKKLMETNFNGDKKVLTLPLAHAHHQ